YCRCGTRRRSNSTFALDSFAASNRIPPRLAGIGVDAPGANDVAPLSSGRAGGGGASSVGSPPSGELAVAFGKRGCSWSASDELPLGGAFAAIPDGIRSGRPIELGTIPLSISAGGFCHCHRHGNLPYAQRRCAGQRPQPIYRWSAPRDQAFALGG